MTRQFIAGAFGGSGKKLQDCMLSELLKEPPKEWEWQTEEEQAETIRQSKAARGMKV